MLTRITISEDELTELLRLEVGARVSLDDFTDISWTVDGPNGTLTAAAALATGISNTATSKMLTRKLGARMARRATIQRWEGKAGETADAAFVLVIEISEP